MLSVNQSSAYNKPRVHGQEFWTEPTKIGEDSTENPRPNRGQFRRGYDPRRHRFTREECIAGFWAAIISIATRYPTP